MSVRVWSLCWKVHLPGIPKLVLLRLADFANESGGSIYPAVSTVADDCGISSRTVQNALRTLEEAGVLVAIKTSRGGRGCTTSYRIDLARAVEMAGPAKMGEHPGNTEIRNYESPSYSFDTEPSEARPENHETGSRNYERRSENYESPSIKGEQRSYNPSLTVKNPPPPEKALIQPGGGGSDIQQIIAEFDRLLLSCFGEVAARERVARCDPGFAGKWLEMVGGSVEAVVDALGTVVERESLKPNGKIPGSLAMFQDSILPELRAYGTESSLTATDLNRNGHGRSNGTISTTSSPGGDLWKKVFQDARNSGLKEIEDRIKALVAKNDIATANDFARSMEAVAAGKKARAAA